VIWAKFLTREVDVIEYCTRDIFSGRFFYLKLFTPDNRIQNDWEDENIDFTFAGGKGHIIKLY
jgi:hypothetical protein